MIDDISTLSASELVEAYRAKRLSPVEATEAALARIDAHNDTINAYLLVDLQIVGPMHRDALVLRAARAFEVARPFADRRPAL